MDPTSNNGDKGALLRELRIDPGQREQPPAVGRRIGLVAVIVLLCLLLAGAAFYVFLQHRAIEVQSVTAVAPAAGDQGATSVLQATGYVTARREATVSAQ